MKTMKKALMIVLIFSTTLLTMPVSGLAGPSPAPPPASTVTRHPTGVWTSEVKKSPIHWGWYVLAVVLLAGGVAAAAGGGGGGGGSSTGITPEQTGSATITW